MKRQDIEEKYKWDFSDYFANDSDYENSFNSLQKLVKEISHYKGRLNNEQDILSCLKKIEEMSVLADSLFVYASCIRDLDITDDTNMARCAKMENMLTFISEETAFVDPELSQCDDQFLINLAVNQSFFHFNRFLLDILRHKPHILPYESEKLLSSMSFADDFSSIHSTFENGDLTFKNVENKDGDSLEFDQNIASIYLKSDDNILRENAYRELNGAFGRYNNFLATNYYAHVKKDVFYSKIRKFNSVLDMALFNEEVPTIVYQTLIKNVENNLSLEHEYFELKRKILGLDKFKLSDVYYNPIKLNKKYTYEEAIDIVCDALSILGKDYTDYLRKMQSSRMIDVYPTDNKRSGAYETISPTKTPRVLTNFMGLFGDVSTLAHELGHAMHSVYSNSSNPPMLSSYTIFLAEIASTVNETLLSKFMIENASTDEEKLYFIGEYLSEFHATVFRQTMFASFEDKIHKFVENDEPLTRQLLNDTYFDLVKKYFGEKVTMLEEVKYEWSRIPHFFTSFYVYKYATGIICAINIAENLSNGKITVDDYKSFLSSGDTASPCEILKKVKIDLQTDEPYIVAFSYIQNLLNSLNSLLVK